jgi:endoglucanase
MDRPATQKVTPAMRSAPHQLRWLVLLSTALLLLALGATAATGEPGRAHAAYAQECPDPYSAHRNPANPLMLPQTPGQNPLRGARLFINGPAHGAAASAIAAMVGAYGRAGYDDSYSWSQFKQDLGQGALRQRLQANPQLGYKVQLLEKIAQEPEPQRFSLYSGGGGAGAIFGQVQKIFCNTLTADPGSIPIITTYFLYQAGYCETRSQILANRARFDGQIDEMAAGIARRPAVMLLEIDAIGSSYCMALNGALPYWEADIRYEIDEIAALPHTVVYIEGGYSDANGPGYTARLLNAVGVRKIRGFFTNDTHNQWTVNEIRWGDRVSQLTHGAHFIVNTATNGRGPLLNPDPVTQGIEDLCNAPGRGIGPRPTTRTGFRQVDAFLWTGPPGNSSGSCHGGTPAGTFWLGRALGLASRAQGKLGPGYPRDAY